MKNKFARPNSLVSVTFSFFFCCILFLTGCNQPKPRKTFIIGFSQCQGGDDWRKTMLGEMKRELSFHDNITLVYEDAEGSSKKQISQIAALVKQHVDLLIVSPNEVALLTPIIQQVYNSGMPVVLVDRYTDSSKYTAYIGASNFEVGQNAARYAVSVLKGKGGLVEIGGLPNGSPFIDRHKGFMDVINKNKGIKYIKKLEDHASNYKEDLTNTLASNKDIDLIFAQSDYIARDAYEVCKKLGLDKKIKIIGIDGLPSKGGGMEMVSDKMIAATVLYPTGGKEAISTSVNILENKPYKKETQLFTTVIDSTNVRILKMQNEKMLEQDESIDRSQQKIEDLAMIARNQTNIIYTISILLALALILGGILFYYFKENKKINEQLALQNNEILNQRNRLIQLSKEVKEATDAKINFFTNISHEFRTPLTLIIAPLEELLSNPKINFASKQYLGLIQKNVMRLLRLINQLIDFRKIESHKMKVQASENDLVSFTNDIVENFKSMAKKRHIDLQVFTKEPKIALWFDTSMLDKVIFNLLSNAFKFTNDDGYIHIHLDRITAANLARIRVDDNGIGMKPEVAKHAFDLFYQGDITNKQGSGLGLALSRELIALHGGQITVNSKLGKGTTFEIELPLGIAHLQKDEMVYEKSDNDMLYKDERLYLLDMVDGNNGGSLEHEKINDHEYSVLVIEDNPDLRNFLEATLGRGYEVLVADNGISALEKAFENIPDLIVSDVVLPGKDGISITNILKSDFRTSHIPIILLTAKTAIEEKIEGMKSMADAYIVKPFNVKYLEETVKSLMKNREILKNHYTTELSLETKSQTPKKLDRRFINEFTAIIENNIGNEGFSIEELAKEMGVSRMQLYRKVKALLGYNINDYILDSRLQKAKYYLSEGELSMSEISFKVGFGSPAYFSKVFKTKYGMTPKEYREK